MGKSTLAKMVGQVWGGCLSFSHREDIGKIKTRLLTPGGLHQRVCLLDNLKSLKFSWSELEAMITADSIGGHRLYFGEAQRPNTLNWFITLNGASLSTDMAQRSVLVKLESPDRSGTWADDTYAFIREHRDAIIADVIGFLRSEGVELSRFTRWSNWERDIVARLPDPGEAQKVIEERQATADVEREEAEMIEDYFAGQLRWLGYREEEWVFVPANIANEWYCRAQNDRATTWQTTRIMAQMANEGRLKRIRPHRMGNARGVLWTSDSYGMAILTDLNERRAQRRE